MNDGEADGNWKHNTNLETFYLCTALLSPVSPKLQTSRKGHLFIKEEPNE